MPVVALTGATGFIGRALAARLLHPPAGSDALPSDIEVRALVRGRGRLDAAHDRLIEIDGALDKREGRSGLLQTGDDGTDYTHSAPPPAASSK